MTMNEVITLMALIATVVHVTFEITWKVSHDDKKDRKNKKD